jgi:hypothetical protein
MCVINGNYQYNDCVTCLPDQNLDRYDFGYDLDRRYSFCYGWMKRWIPKTVLPESDQIIYTFVYFVVTDLICVTWFIKLCASSIWKFITIVEAKYIKICVHVFGKKKLCLNYTWIKGRRATSCAAKPFWIAKSNLWKTTFIDLGDTTLLCMTFWILFKRFTASGAKKPKVSNANGIKIQKCRMQMV